MDIFIHPTFFADTTPLVRQPMDRLSARRTMDFRSNGSLLKEPYTPWHKGKRLVVITRIENVSSCCIKEADLLS
jgi:hypothetical protein